MNGPKRTGRIYQEKKYRRIKKLILTFIVSLLAVVFLFPLILTVTNSFLSEQEIKENFGLNGQSPVFATDGSFYRLKLIPDQVVFSQYLTILFRSPRYLLLFWNSVFITVPVICGQLLVGSLAAYAFSRLRFKGREYLFYLYLATMLMPFQVSLVPNFLIVDKLGLLETYAAVILPGIFGTFGVFLLHQFMTVIPYEYSEAALVEGATHFQIFFRIILPLSKPGLATLCILLFIDHWNLVEQPLIFLQENQRPLSVFLAQINAGERGVAFAAAVIYMTPVLLLFLYGRRYFVRGIQLSGLQR